MPGRAEPHPSEPVPVTVYVVRHAHAGSRRDWAGPDAERPLSERGWRQAKGLAEVLDRTFDARPVRLLASPAVRCRQTLEPLGALLGTEVEVEDRLREGTSGVSARLLLEECGDDVVLCSHGDVIPDLLDVLAAEGARFDDDLRWPKASTWVLTLDGTVVVRARYLAPPA